MINNDKDFEAALEKVAVYLEAPPVAGTVDDREFTRLLQAIQAYAPTIPPLEPRTAMADLADRAAALTERANAFQRRREERAKSGTWGGLSQDGRGIGPGV